jgi:hypothetical protein
VALFKETAPDNFGRFNRAFVSMFRLAAGETWVEALPLLSQDGDIEWKSSLFICTYVIVNVWVVLQVRRPCSQCQPKAARRLGAIQARLQGRFSLFFFYF